MSDETVSQTPEQERASAEAAFAITSEIAPVKAAPEDDKVKAADTPAEPALEIKPDPWDGVPGIVRETLEGINGKLGKFDALGNDMKAGIGRIAAMQSELAAAKAAASKVDNAPTDEQIAAAATSPEKWDQLKELFKDWSDEFNATEAIDERITGRLAAERTEMLKAIPQVDVDGIKKEVRELARIDMKYPTWEDDIYAPEGGFSPDFAAWRNAQPPEIQALGASALARDSIKMLGLYYDHRKKIAEQEKNKQRLESAIPAKGTPGQRQQTPSQRASAENALASA